MEIKVRKLDDGSWYAWAYDTKGKYIYTNELTKKYAVEKLKSVLEKEEGKLQ